MQNTIGMALRKRIFWIASALLLLTGLSLRLLGARGDLWLDEIWSLDLLKPITSPYQIFWKINHANNHYLNSLWMYALGPYWPGFVYRVPSVLWGTLTIAAAGWWGNRRGRAAGLAAVLLFATSYAMVDYGSEARGYSGLVLFLIVSLCLLESCLQGKDKRWLLALAILGGLVSQVLMILCIIALVVWTAWTEAARKNGAGQWVIVTLRIFWKPLLLTLPLLACIGIAVVRHRYVVGPPFPFNAAKYVEAYGRMIEAASSIPGIDSSLPYTIAAGVLSLGWFGLRRRADARAKFYVVAIVVLPLLLMGARPPVANMSRYFVLSGTAWLLMLADIAGYLWARGRVAQVAVLAGLAVILYGNVLFLRQFLANGRGHYANAVAYMTEKGPARFAASDKGNTESYMLEMYYARQLGHDLTVVQLDEWCGAPPDFLVLDRAQERTEVTTGPDACPTRFVAPRYFAEWGLAGISWTVYRRE